MALSGMSIQMLMIWVPVFLHLEQPHGKIRRPGRIDLYPGHVPALGFCDLFHDLGRPLGVGDILGDDEQIVETVLFFSDR